jgi:putative DNA primase/helicase
MLPIDRVLERLDGVKKSGGQWVALCPAHDDHQQSLSIGNGRDDRVVMKCHAGCKTEDIVKTIGLEMKDLFVSKPKGDGVERTYDYCDEEGKLLFQCVRRQGKQFRQRRPNGAGGWIWDLKGVPRVLYRLPELLASEDEWAFICEGEKSSDAIRNLGLTATTSPMGAGKWRSEYAEFLKGRKVCVLPDNDEAGRAHAQDILKTLPGALTLELPGLDYKEDPFDWVANGGTRDELMKLVVSAQTTDSADERPFLLDEGADDAGNAACLNKMFGGEFLYCDSYGWLHYNGRYWDRELVGAKLTRATVETLKARQHAAVEAERERLVRAAKPSAYNVRSCIEIFKSLVGVDVNEFDTSPDHINCQNGVVDLRTGELTPHSPDQRFTYCLPVKYNPDADRSEWTEWLLEATGNRLEVAQYLQEAVGYSITGHTWEECLFYIYGPTRAGKGTFVETILAMLGKAPLAVEVDFTTFTGKLDGDGQNFGLAPLKPSRFVAASESGKYQQLNTERIKSITGGNDIRCAFKYRTHFSYRPQFKLWLSSNHPINADAEDDALWSRVRVIEFPNSYLGREDKRLKQRMRSPEVLEGVLAWAVEGAIRWYQLGSKGLETPEIVAEATAQARKDLDYVGQWIDECVAPADDPEHFVTNEVIRASYETWCSNNGVNYPKGSGALTRSLKGKGYDAGVSQKKDGRTYRGCKGIVLRLRLQ